MENGDIRIYFCLGVYKSGFKKGLEHDHGVTFGIKESDLCKLYEEVLEWFLFTLGMWGCGLFCNKKTTLYE